MTFGMLFAIVVGTLFFCLALNLVHKAIQSIKGYRWWYRNIYLHTWHWRFTRKVKFLLSGRRCGVPGCTFTHYVDVHHRTYKHIWWEWLFPWDLQVLCRHHHILEHRGGPND